MGNTVIREKAIENVKNGTKVNKLLVPKKIVTVIIDDQIQFEVDITDDNGDKTCGWLLAEVTRKYTLMLKAIQNREVQKHLLNAQVRQEVRMPRHKRRYIVALKTDDGREGVDSWLNQYERDLSILRDGTVLIAHFASINLKTGINLTQNREVTIEDFEQIKIVGRGGFSRVVLARKKDTGRLYAIKILKKQQLASQNQIYPILSERKVLSQLNHPFLIKLHWAFQSSLELFFVMDICTGGELFFHLIEQRRFSERTAKFYMSEILLGFRYMHERDIVYRDIKPENILVDMDGHLRIADFGLAKVIPENERSHSFCGSPEYLCPEMLGGSEGHDRRLDIYSLGVLLFEMLTGLPPFYHEDHAKMFDQILREDLVLDQSYLSLEVKNLLSNMLEKDPVLRQQSISEVMQHPWFADVKWDQVFSKQVEPPFVPDINQNYFENCDSEHDEHQNSNHSRISQRHESGANRSRTALRRRSYYVHSTMQLPSCIDEQASFLHSPSQVRMMLDYSASNLDESRILQNLNTSYFEGANLVNRSMLIQHLRSSPRAREASDILNLSNQPDLEGPFQRVNENFSDFCFISPPLAEMQILRVLETLLARKRKDQLEYIRQSREKILLQKEGNKQGAEKRKGHAQAQTPLTSLSRPLFHPQSRQSMNYNYKQASQSVLSIQHLNSAQRNLANFTSDNQAVQSQYYHRGNQRSSITELRVIGVSIADEYTANDDFQSSYLPAALQDVMAEIPIAENSTSPINIHISRSLSLDSFPRVTKHDHDTVLEEVDLIEKSSFFCEKAAVNQPMSPQPGVNIRLMQADLSKINFSQCHSARISLSFSELSATISSEKDSSGDLQSMVYQQAKKAKVKAINQHEVPMENDQKLFIDEEMKSIYAAGLISKHKEFVRKLPQEKKTSRNQVPSKRISTFNSASILEDQHQQSKAQNDNRNVMDSAIFKVTHKSVEYKESPFKIAEHEMSEFYDFEECERESPALHNDKKFLYKYCTVRELETFGDQSQTSKNKIKNKLVSQITTPKMPRFEEKDEDDTLLRNKAYDSDGAMTFGGFHNRVSAASSDVTLENGTTVQSNKYDSRLSSRQSGCKTTQVKYTKLCSDLSPVREMLTAKNIIIDRKAKLSPSFNTVKHHSTPQRYQTFSPEPSLKGKKKKKKQNSNRISPSKKVKKLQGVQGKGSLKTMSQPFRKEARSSAVDIVTPKFPLNEDLKINDTLGLSSSKQIRSVRSAMINLNTQKHQQSIESPRHSLVRLPSPTTNSLVTNPGEVKKRHVAEPDQDSSSSGFLDSICGISQVADEKMSLHDSQISSKAPISGVIRTQQIAGGILHSSRQSSQNPMRGTMSLRHLLSKDGELRFQSPNQLRRTSDSTGKSAPMHRRDQSTGGLISGFYQNRPPSILKYKCGPSKSSQPNESLKRSVQTKLIHGSSHRYGAYMYQTMPQKIMNFSVGSPTKKNQTALVSPRKPGNQHQLMLTTSQSQPWKQQKSQEKLCRLSIPAQQKSKELINVSPLMRNTSLILSQQKSRDSLRSKKTTQTCKAKPIIKNGLTVQKKVSKNTRSPSSVSNKKKSPNAKTAVRKQESRNNSDLKNQNNHVKQLSSLNILTSQMISVKDFIFEATSANVPCRQILSESPRVASSGVIQTVKQSSFSKTLKGKSTTCTSQLRPRKQSEPVKSKSKDAWVTKAEIQSIQHGSVQKVMDSTHNMLYASQESSSQSMLRINQQRLYGFLTPIDDLCDDSEASPIMQTLKIGPKDVRLSVSQRGMKSSKDMPHDFAVTKYNSNNAFSNQAMMR